MHQRSLNPIPKILIFFLSTSSHIVLCSASVPKQAKPHVPIHSISGKWYMPVSVSFENHSVGISNKILQENFEEFKYLYFQRRNKDSRKFKGKYVYYFPRNGVGRFKMRAYFWDPNLKKSSYVDFLGEHRSTANPWFKFNDSNGQLSPLTWNGPIRPNYTELTMSRTQAMNLEPTYNYPNCTLEQICPRLPKLIFSINSEETQSLDARASYDEYVKSGGVIVDKPRFGILSMIFGKIGYLKATISIKFKLVKNIKTVDVDSEGNLLLVE